MLCETFRSVIITIFIPAYADAIKADTLCAWILCDAAGGMLRSGTSAISDIPRAHRTWVVIPAARVLFTELILPPVSAARLAALLPFAVEDKLMSDPASIHAVVSPVKRGKESVVAVIDKSWLRALLNALGANAIVPELVIPESELTRCDAGEWSVSLREKEGFLVRDDGFAVAFDYSADREPPLALRLALKESAQRSQSPRLVRVESVDTSFDTSSGAALDSASWGNTLGVAIEAHAASPAHKRISRLLEKPGQRIDFLSGAFARRGNWNEGLSLLRPALIISAVMLGLHVIFSAFDWWRLDQERRALESAMVSVFKSAFPDARAIVDPALQMRRNLETLKRERGIATDNAFLAQLARAATLIEGDGEVKTRGAQWDGKRLTLDVEARNALALDPLKARLSGAGVQIGPIDQRGERVIARLRFEAGE